MIQDGTFTYIIISEYVTILLKLKETLFEKAINVLYNLFIGC